MQFLINVLYTKSCKVDAIINVRKTSCMVFNPTDKLKIVSNSFINFICNSEVLKFVNFFKYLGYILSCDFMDDGDVKREIRSLFGHANVVSRHFSKCSLRV